MCTIFFFCFSFLDGDESFNQHNLAQQNRIRTQKKNHYLRYQLEIGQQTKYQKFGDKQPQV